MSIKEDDIKAGRMVYSCNCGWVDLGHANGKSTRQYVGATSLWNQLVKESGRPSKVAAGFKVTYKQDMGLVVGGVIVYSTGTEKSYRVNLKLTTGEKESVALSIFLEVSRAFETLQGEFPWSWRTGSSSFSQEDLVSDLIGFYNTVRPGTDYIRLCKTIGKDESLKVFNSMSAGEREKKNPETNPLFYACEKCSSPTFPPELQKITPAVKGKLFRDWDKTDQDGNTKISPNNYWTPILPLIIAAKVRPARTSGKNPMIG